MMEYWNDGKMEDVGAKHSWQGVKVIPAAVNKNASPLVDYRSVGEDVGRFAESSGWMKQRR